MSRVKADVNLPDPNYQNKSSRELLEISIKNRQKSRDKITFNNWIDLLFSLILFCALFPNLWIITLLNLLLLYVCIRRWNVEVFMEELSKILDRYDR